MRIGIEIGGTFTDLVLLDDDGRVATHKVPSTPADPSIGAMAGLRALLAREGRGAAAVGELVHGSTIATNTLIERKGARSALITTAGFEDVLQIGRQDKTQVYDLFYRKPAPLVERSHIVGIAERLDGQGEVVRPLEAAEIDRAIDAVLALPGVASVAVMLLHAYRNPVHEQAIKARWLARGIALPLSLSSDIAPEFREYERASTTTIAAYVKPRVADYLARLDGGLAAEGFRGSLLIMQSNGGVVPVELARENPARMFLSGPAAGVTGASYVARRVGLPELLTIDIGGTSCDACVLTGGVPQETQHGFTEYRIDGLPISLKMTDIATLGAGGGSIAWVDGSDTLQVGPGSAGADPGPACYGRGGTEFTVSDALLLLGQLDPDRFVGGSLQLDPGAALRAAEPLCRRLGLDPVGLATAVRRVTVANIARALRLVTVQRGHDPRAFALFAYGGAGPVFAADIAQELGMRSVVVPNAPGLFSAFGLSVSDLRLDHVRAMPGLVANAEQTERVLAAFEAMRAEALAAFAGFQVPAASVEIEFSLDARYRGQGYELKVPAEPDRIRAEGGLGSLVAGFHAAHQARYALSFPEQAVEIIACRAVARHRLRATPAPPPALRGAARPRHREVVFGTARHDAPWHDRDTVPEAGEGPAVIAETSSATLVPPGWSWRVVPTGEILLTRHGA
jgi:N-methylhydantoinase A